jgi:phosphatidylinositol alpha-1,6-mannosyltransferase
MRILLTTPDYPPMTGGIQLLLDRLVRHSRFSYKVVTLSAPTASGLFSTPPGVTRVPRFGGQRSAIGLLNAITIARAIAWRPDAMLSGHIVTGPAALTMQTLLGTPVIQYLYGKELGERPELSRLVTKHARATVAISSHTRQQALTLGTPADRIHLILPGVDPPSTPPPLLTSRDAGARPTIVTVARLRDRYKGFDVMIRALPLIRARVPNAHWVVVGDGPLRGELQTMASSLGVADFITFAGILDNEARDECLAQADVFAMPSRLLPDNRGGEGFGIVYLEAGSHGLPCVAGNVGGSVDAVIDGETGLLVDPTDHLAVADAIATLLLNPALRLRLGEAGRARAKQLSWTRMAGEIDTLVERVLTAGKK